ncbi:MAG: alpha/beta hydrolase, partial [Lewinella sp.]
MRSFLPLLFLSVLCTCVRAQKLINFGQSYELRSEVLAEDRLINVLLPAEYADSTEKKYPVIYLLDGATNEDFFHVSGLLRYFNDHHMMPPAILVGIANVDRKRDFTYPSKDPRDVRDFPTTGGSAKFIDFLQRELPVFVNKTFRTTEHKTLIGQSLGGLLATEI